MGLDPRIFGPSLWGGLHLARFNILAVRGHVEEMERCQCKHCQSIIQRNDTYIPYVDKFRDDIRNGVVQHIGYTGDGKPLYRQIKD